MSLSGVKWTSRAHASMSVNDAKRTLAGSLLANKDQFNPEAFWSTIGGGGDSAAGYFKDVRAGTVPAAMTDFLYSHPNWKKLFELTEFASMALRRIHNSPRRREN